MEVVFEEYGSSLAGPAPRQHPVRHRLGEHDRGPGGSGDGRDERSRRIDLELIPLLGQREVRLMAPCHGREPAVARFDVAEVERDDDETRPAQSVVDAVPLAGVERRRAAVEPRPVGPFPCRIMSA